MAGFEQIAEPLSRGGMKIIRDMSDGELVRILKGKKTYAGTKVAALRVLRDQEKCDRYGSVLLREELNSDQLESVLLRMSDTALQMAIKTGDLPVDPIKIAASRVIDERHASMRRTARSVRHQADLGF